MTAPKVKIFVILAILALIGVIYAFSQQPAMAPTVQNNADKLEIAVGEANPSVVVEYKGEEGKNALELLRESYEVRVQSYSFGDMVTSINGIEAGSNHFWAFYVNGEMSQVGASQYETKAEDEIKWQLDKIQ